MRSPTCLQLLHGSYALNTLATESQSRITLVFLAAVSVQMTALSSASRMSFLEKPIFDQHVVKIRQLI